MTEPHFYRRPLPSALVPFASPEGRRLFREALEAGHLEGWFALSEQFQTQSDPAFCGLGTLVVALNALGIDPGRVWKGPWRWYSEELLDCCLPLDAVRARGVTLGQFACLARCNGASATVRRADVATVDELRRDLDEATAAHDGVVVAASYSRRALGQTGDGHFSPVAGLHAARDLALVLDVARFKYPPHWAPVTALFDAMRPVDPVTGHARGWVVLRRRTTPGESLLLRLATAHARSLDVANGLVVDAARALAERPPPALPELLDALAQLVGSRVAALPRALDALDPTTRAAVDRLRAELAASPIRAGVSAAAPALATGLADLVALLALTLPPHALSPASPSLRAQLRAASEQLPAALSGELVAVREQLAALLDGGGARDVDAAPCALEQGTLSAR